MTQVSEASAILAIAHRDFIKLLRDRARIISDFSFPLIFIFVLGSGLQAGFGEAAGINLLFFVFTGVLAQTVWMSAFQGVTSLIADREQDFSQEMFVSPISRYSIIFGKILGESLVGLPQGLFILAFGLLIGVPISLPIFVALLPTLALCAVFGGARTSGKRNRSSPSSCCPSGSWRASSIRLGTCPGTSTSCRRSRRSAMRSTSRGTSTTPGVRASRSLTYRPTLRSSP